jgi:hypothetical protein
VVDLFPKITDFAPTKKLDDSAGQLRILARLVREEFG